VEVGWRDSPAQAVRDGETADVVIGDSLALADIMDRLDPLADIIKPGRIDPAGFYPGLLAMGSRDNRPLLLPLAFDLPAVVMERRATTGELPAMMLPLATMRTMAAAFTSQGKGGGLATVGFPPLWDPEFILLVARLFGARPRAGRPASFTWDPEPLAQAVEFTRSWVARDNGGATSELAFIRRNLTQQPWDRLLASRKILFVVVPFTEYAALPEEKRRDLEFRWLSRDDRVPVLDDVIFAGVPRSARNKRGARAFLDWLAQPATQRSLLEANRSRRLGVFGVFGGFSALESLNEKELPQQHPLLLGHVPPEGSLAFPEPLPAGWDSASADVILPWLAKAAAGEATGTLEGAVEAWQASVRR
jgi:ABC-type glycerol-3-phosphate transport system substrate-binding protein